MPAPHPKAYVRLAKPSELPAVARVLTRAFAKDPAMNWYGCLPKMVDDIDSPSPVNKRSMRNLTWFQAALVKATVLVDGALVRSGFAVTDSNGYVPLHCFTRPLAVMNSTV